MNRFFGMMPSTEVELSKRYIVGVMGGEVTIQAGKNGWTILYADSSSEYDDVVDTAENNLNKAYQILQSRFCEIKEMTNIE